MITISLCMIVKNEEDTLGNCLESVRDIVDEIIIVDTGSSDRTKEVAGSYTSKIYDFEWIDDFSAARNYSFLKATMDYIMWLDADDVILEEDALKIQQLKVAIDPIVDIVMMKYNNFDENGHITLSYFRARLLKRSSNFIWNEPIHEYIQPSGYIIDSDICITHKKICPSASKRNLNIFEKMIAANKVLSPRSLFYYAKELFNNERFDDAIKNFNEYLDSGNGWDEDRISACYDLSICYSFTNEPEKRLKALIRSFEFSPPRAEICCQIGYHYFEQGDYEKAIVWYKIATQLTKPVNTWGFILHDCWGYISNIQLCLCYDRLGNIEEAIKYNNKAAEYKPNDAAVLYNVTYFRKLRIADADIFKSNTDTNVLIEGSIPLNFTNSNY